MERERERVSRPDRLEALPSIVTPWQWGLSLVLSLAVIYALLWSFMGTVTRRITLPGIVTDATSGNDPLVQVYLSPESTRQVRTGQAVLAYPVGVAHSQAIRGTVGNVANKPRHQQELEKTLVHSSLLVGVPPWYPATVRLNDPTGALVPGFFVRVSIIVSRQKPIIRIFPFLQKFR